jgi:hypothetical protein
MIEHCKLQTANCKLQSSYFAIGILQLDLGMGR